MKKANSMIHIYFRHYREDLYSDSSRDPNKRRPGYYSPELCAFSILSGILSRGLKDHYKFHVWYDGSEEDYISDPILSVFEKFGSEVPILALRRNHRGLGDNRCEKISWPALIDYCSINHEDNDYLYFIENDYLHDPIAMQALHVMALNSEIHDYLTLYDSPDYYSSAIHRKFRGDFYSIGGISWREVLTATASFLVKARTLREDANVFLQHSDFDCFTRLVGLKGRRLLAPFLPLSSHEMIGSQNPVRSTAEIVKSFHIFFPELGKRYSSSTAT